MAYRRLHCSLLHPQPRLFLFQTSYAYLGLGGLFIASHIAPSGPKVVKFEIHVDVVGFAALPVLEMTPIILTIMGGHKVRYLTYFTLRAYLT